MALVYEWICKALLLALLIVSVVGLVGTSKRSQNLTAMDPLLFPSVEAASFRTEITRRKAYMAEDFVTTLQGEWVHAEEAVVLLDDNGDLFRSDRDRDHDFTYDREWAYNMDNHFNRLKESPFENVRVKDADTDPQFIQNPCEGSNQGDVVNPNFCRNVFRGKYLKFTEPFYKVPDTELQEYPMRLNLAAYTNTPPEGRPFVAFATMWGLYFAGGLPVFGLFAQLVTGTWFPEYGIPEANWVQNFAMDDVDGDLPFPGKDRFTETINYFNNGRIKNAVDRMIWAHNTIPTGLFEVKFTHVRRVLNQ